MRRKNKGTGIDPASSARQRWGKPMLMPIWIRSVTCCLCLSSFGADVRDGDGVLDCAGVEMITEAYRAICSEDWRSLARNRVRELWPGPLRDVYVPGKDWALLVAAPIGREDDGDLCTTSLMFEISLDRTGNVATERLHDITVKRTTHHIREAWELGMTLLTMIDVANGCRVCDRGEWKLDETGKQNYWWCQQEHMRDGTPAWTSAITMAITGKEGSWTLFLAYSKTDKRAVP